MVKSLNMARMNKEVNAALQNPEHSPTPKELLKHYIEEGRPSIRLIAVMTVKIILETLLQAGFTMKKWHYLHLAPVCMSK